MNFKAKIIGSLALLSTFFLPLPPLAWAQNALDDIKSHLQESGINVVDYGAPEDEWGSLSQEWVVLLKDEGYENIAGLAAEFEDYFVGEASIAGLKDQLALAEVQKSRLTIASEIQEKNDEIEDLNNQILILDNDLKEELAALVMGLDYSLIGETSTSEMTRQGVNLLASEIDFFYNYNKWGPLPSRIVGILKLNDSHFESLSDMAEQIDTESEATMEAGFEFLRSLFSNYEGLSDADIELIVNSTKIYLAGGAGESQINQIGLTIARTIQNVVGGVAVLWIVIAGLRMIFADGDEGVIKEQKDSIFYGILGLVVILLAGRLVEVLYGSPGVNRTDLIQAQDVGFSNEIYGLVAFLKALVGTVAIFFIVLSGIRTLFAQGDESQITKERTSILWVGAGLILIAINEIVVENIFTAPIEQSDQISTSNVGQIINTVGNIMQFLLGFVGLITLGILIYGAASMILNFGNDEMVERAKKIIRNAIIGILIILSAYVIVASLVVFN